MAGMGGKRLHLILGKAVQFMRAVKDAFSHQMNDTFRAPLHLAFHQHQTRAHDRVAKHFNQPRPDHHIGNACLIAQGCKDNAGIARHLTDQDDTRAFDFAAVAGGIYSGTVHNPLPAKQIAQEKHQMRLQREPQHPLIGQHMFAQRHRRQGFDKLFRLLIHMPECEQRQGIVIGNAAYRPKDFAPVHGD